MNFLQIIAFCSLLLLTKSTITIGQIDYNYGSSQAFVTQSGGVGEVSVSGSSVKFNSNSGAFFTNSSRESYSPDMFLLFNLLGKKFKFTIDLHEAGCGCNAALYFTSMPAYNSNQQVDPTKCGNYYCDANSVCGIYCPELDVIEANNKGIQITPHKCAEPTGKYYNWCDGRGCGQNVQKSNPSLYGWGSDYLINTQKPFDVEMSLKAVNGQLSSIETVLKQEGRSHTIIHSDSNCGAGYLSDITKPLNYGMVLIFSYWGDASSGNDMTWLDSPPCDGTIGCNQGSQVIFSNIAVI